MKNVVEEVEVDVDVEEAEAEAEECRSRLWLLETGDNREGNFNRIYCDFRVKTTDGCSL